MALSGTPQSAVSIWSLYPCQVSRMPRAFLFVPRSQSFGRSSSIAFRLMPFACRSRRESAFGLSSPLRGRPGQHFGTSTFGFATAASRPSMAVEPRDTWPMSAPPSPSATRASCIPPARREAENSANARENVASLGISPRRDQLHNRRNAGSAPSLSIKCRVVGRSPTGCHHCFDCLPDPFGCRLDLAITDMRVTHGRVHGSTDSFSHF